MAIRPFQCINCGYSDVFFDYEIRDQKATCVKCNGKDFTKLMAIPSDNKITIDSKDYYSAAKQEVGIQEDLRKRSTKHVNDTLSTQIEETKQQFGEVEGLKICKEQGWIRSDDGGKTWRIRTDFDTGTLGASNSGSIKPNLGKNEK
jgi:hypothetical protein